MNITKMQNIWQSKYIHGNFLFSAVHLRELSDLGQRPPKCPSSDHVLGNTVVRQRDSTQQPFTEVGAFPFECSAQMKNNVRQRYFFLINLNKLNCFSIFCVVEN